MTDHGTSTARTAPVGRWGSVLVAVAATLVACLGWCGENPDFAENAPAATRLATSPNGEFTLAEIRGNWQREEYGRERAEHVPGVIKILDADGEIADAATGWSLGPPADDGSFLFIDEAPHEYSYRVRDSSGRRRRLETPEGVWHVKAGMGDPSSGCAVAVFWSIGEPPSPDTRRDRLWLVSFDREALEIRAERMLEWTRDEPEEATEVAEMHGRLAGGRFRLPGAERYGRGVAVGRRNGRATVAVLEQKQAPVVADDWPDFRVRALSCRTLDVLWTRVLPDPLESKSEQDRDSTSEPGLNDHLSFTGTGDHVVVYGLGGRRQIWSLSVDDGAVEQFRAEAGAEGDRIVDTAPVPESDEIAFHSRSSTSYEEGLFGHGGTQTSRYFQGIRYVNARTGETRRGANKGDLSRPDWESEREMLFSAFTIRGGEILLAPRTHGDVRRHHVPSDSERRRPKASGDDRPEVRRWLSIPREWHRRDRPAVQRRDRWMARRGW